MLYKRKVKLPNQFELYLGLCLDRNKELCILYGVDALDSQSDAPIVEGEVPISDLIPSFLSWYVYPSGKYSKEDLLKGMTGFKKVRQMLSNVLKEQDGSIS